jgi:hypothetical protein
MLKRIILGVAGLVAVAIWSTAMPADFPDQRVPMLML